MFRNPNWFVYRRPLRSSFCTCLSLSMSCDVVCFFSARPPCGQPQTALTIRRLLWSQEVQRPPSDLLWPKTSSDKASSARSRAALILQQFVYHNRERVGVGFSQVCMVVRCGDAQEAACCECFACDGGGPSWTLLSTAVDSGKESTVWETHAIAIYSLSELTRLPLQWSDVATLSDPDFCNMHKRDTQLKRCEGSGTEECGGAVISELKRQKVPPCGWCPVVPAMVCRQSWCGMMPWTSPCPDPVRVSEHFSLKPWCFGTLTGSCTEGRWGLRFALACHSACHVMSFVFFCPSTL